MAIHSLFGLPEDLILYIVRYMDGLLTLKHFALVSREAYAIIERILWRNVIVDVRHLDHEREDVQKDFACPIRTLRLEEDRKENPEWNDEDRNKQAAKASFVRHLSLRKRRIPGEINDYKDGIPSGTTLSLFDTTPEFFSNLWSVRIDGEATRVIWNCLMKLPSIRELRLWRITSPSEDLPPLELHGLSKLRALELGLLSPAEGKALGLALAESRLEKLHFSSTADDFGTAAATFFSAVATKGLQLPLQELAISDNSYSYVQSRLSVTVSKYYSRLIEAPGQTSAVLTLFQNLTCLYLDLITICQLPDLLGGLSLPHLTHLYLPFFYSSDVSNDDKSGARYQPLLALLERHKETLLEFHLLNAVADKDVVQYFQRQVNSWLRLEEVRIDSVHTDDHNQVLQAGLEWTRTSEYLGVDGRDFWGRQLYRARLDRFNLTGIHTGFISDYVWQKLRILVLNPSLAWHEGIFPEPHDHVSPRIRDQNQEQALGAGRPLQDTDCAEKKMAESIVRRLNSRSIRVIAIHKFRFWVDPSGRVVWYLRDALEDSVQGPLVHQLLSPKDWAFLSERSTPKSYRAAGVASFFRCAPEQSSPAASALRYASVEEGLSVRVMQVLDGRSTEEFLQLPLAERTLVLRRLLVASKPIWIWDEGVMGEHDDSIAEDATLLLQDCCTRSHQLSVDAQEIYYTQNVFRLSLHSLGEFLHAYEPYIAKDFVRSLIIQFSVSADGWDDMDDFLQLLDCKQITQIRIEAVGNSYSEIDEKLRSSPHILKQLEDKAGTKLQIRMTIS